MKLPRNKKVIAVHDGNFHPDDVFSVALLSIIFKGKIRVIRTRDEAVCSRADFVLDVGGKYLPKENRFDHHQIGGAGIRENKIPYSTFGLLWKKFGEKVCGSKEIADILESKIVTSVDADDNGFVLCANTVPGSKPFMVANVIYSMRPTWKESEGNINKFFLKAVDFVKEIIIREIKVAKDKAEIIKVIQSYYKKSTDKRLIVVGSPKVSRYDAWDALQNFSEPLFIVYGEKKDWSVVAMRESSNSFASREKFPAEWCGLRDEDFARKTGVVDALFCHKDLFLAGAKSKAGVIKLAELALLEANNK